MEEKIIEILTVIQEQVSQTQEQVSRTQEQVSQLQEQMSQTQEQVSHMQEQMNRMEGDISTIKETVDRIEAHQHDDLVATLERIDQRVKVIARWKEDTDKVVDILAARTTRLQATLNTSP